MTHSAFQVHHVCFVQQHSSSTFRFSDEQSYKVVEETWVGSMITGSVVIARYNTRAEAEAHVKRIDEDETLR